MILKLQPRNKSKRNLKLIEKREEISILLSEICCLLWLYAIM
jgi:hypothetical protein